PCPLDFSVLRNLVQNAKIPIVDRTQACPYLRQGLRLVQSDYLSRTNDFLPPNPAGKSAFYCHILARVNKLPETN
ncbi:unnamed protein product, partial [Linum tenue]